LVFQVKLNRNCYQNSVSLLLDVVQNFLSLKALLTKDSPPRFAMKR